MAMQCNRFQSNASAAFKLKMKHKILLAKLTNHQTASPSNGKWLKHCLQLYSIPGAIKTSSVEAASDVAQIFPLNELYTVFMLLVSMWSTHRQFLNQWTIDGYRLYHCISSVAKKHSNLTNSNQTNECQINWNLFKCWQYFIHEKHHRLKSGNVSSSINRSERVTENESEGEK